MIVYTKSATLSDLEGILSLQKINLVLDLSAEEIQSQGFVTVSHTFDVLKKLNDQEHHIVAKESDRVIGYVLAMTKQARLEIPVLIPMFEAFDAIDYNKKKITEHNFIVVGQVCISKEFRGQGVFDNCYGAYRNAYKDKYDFAITEIASTNLRSLQAHKRIGFREVASYSAPDGMVWIVVIWEWK